MRKPNNTLFIFLGMLLLTMFFIDLITGSAAIPFIEVLKTLAGNGEKESWNYIILNFRLPKAITSLLVGAGLSLAGLMMQTLFRNPLAGPYVLGISSGASLGVALFVMATTSLGGVFLSIFNFMGSWGLVLSAIFGAFLVFFLVLAVSFRVSDTVSILIIGIMFGSITGAIVSVLQYFSKPDVVHNFLVWTFGSLSTVTWKQLQILIPLVSFGIGIGIWLTKSLNALLLGENHARSLGTNIERTRFWVILATSLISGTITAFTGPIAFIGVAIPHIARQVLGTSDHKKLIPASLLIGASLMLICDVISQLPGNQIVLPINSVTAFFGAPVVIWVIIKSRNLKSAF